MSAANLSTRRRAGRYLIAPLAATLMLGALCPQAQAAPQTLYLYKENGMPVYSNRKPENVAYTEVKVGAGSGKRPTASAARPTPAANPGPEDAAARLGWAASCQGVTEETMAERAATLQGLMIKHAKAHGVPAGLVRAVMRVESCFDRRAVSRVGARGLMQLMPATASELGVRDSFDADQNIGAGVRYLRMLLQRFNHDTRLAVAAYNAGPGAVDRHRGVPPFPETRSYVNRVIAAYREDIGQRRKKAVG